jgi:hypothetical protein
METWYPIPTHADYEVSTIGRVRRLGSPEPLRAFKKGSTYQVTLSTGGDKTTHSTASLVRAALPYDVAVELGWIQPPGHKERRLSDQTISEILSLEGIVSPRETAAEFLISESRVLAIWNGGV